MKKSNIVIHIFRKDLRLFDNPALTKASQLGEVLPVYILDEYTKDQIGSASKIWLYYSLKNLNESMNNKILFFSGNFISIIKDLIKKTNPNSITISKEYEPSNILIERQLKKLLNSQKIDFFPINSNLLWDPSKILKDDGSPYRVFTPFYKKGCLNYTKPRVPMKIPTINFYKIKIKGEILQKLDLLPNKKWQQKLTDCWKISEKGALESLDNFLKNGLNGYKINRNFPSFKNTSRLSPYLHFGNISPNVIWHKSRTTNPTNDNDILHFHSELGWREFSYNLLLNNQELSKKNLQPKFDKFPWIKNISLFKAWKEGKTGFPIVDAGMRELYKTGYMHNRLRMIVGSFLVKNLLIHWHEGQKWFWDTLFDADEANNSAGWQWIAGCGADAAPYFRIFNPVTQGEKFDTVGKYTRLFVPELSIIPDKYLFKPWEAPDDVLKKSNIILGKNYPFPIIDLKSSRKNALDAFQTLK